MPTTRSTRRSASPLPDVDQTPHVAPPAAISLTGYPNFDAFERVGDAHDEAIALAGQIYAFQSLCTCGGSVKGDDLFCLFNSLGQQTARVVKAIEVSAARG